MDYIKHAVKLKSQHLGLSDLISEIQHYLIDHFKKLGKSYQAKNILESRFTPPDIAFNIGMSSCGSKTNISTEMLRYIGYEVKKVHGSIPNSVDHSWIKVKDPANNHWQFFDITKLNCMITTKHKAIAECHDWFEIKTIIQEAFINNK